MKKRILTILFASLAVAGFTISASARSLNWKMTSTWPPSISLIEADQAFVKAVNHLAKDKLKIKFFTGGSLMPSYEVFDAVSKGTVQAAGDWSNYWAGKNRAFDALGAYPMGLTPMDYFIWIYNGGGLELYQEVYGKFGIYYLVTGITPMECGIRSNKPIKSIDDLKGMKIRMSGQTQGALLQDLGAAQIAMSGQEIYQAMQKGTIDGAEFSSPSSDLGMGFAEVSRYWAVPGWHQPSSVMGVMINQKVWDSLDKDLQETIKYAAKVATLEFMSKQYFDVIDSTNQFVAKGIQINKYPAKDLERIQGLVNAQTEKIAKDNPLFKKVIKSQMDFRKKFAQWRDMEGPFGFGYTPTTWPDLDK
ncbi:TRAP transporter substrate-binding protein DctP [bacterium]|nr:TRAP transporter substrate-binding protein DctP [bacterium]